MKKFNPYNNRHAILGLLALLIATAATTGIVMVLYEASKGFYQ